MKNSILIVILLLTGLNVRAQKTEVSIGYGAPSAYGWVNMIGNLFSNDLLKSTGVLSADVKLYNENMRWRYGLGITWENFNYEYSSDNSSFFSITPSADYFWTKPERKFRVYSGASLGLLFYNYKNYNTDFTAKSGNETVLAINIVPIGMRYGESLAVYLEPLNFGVKGIIQAGVSYRF